jgi:gamma-glutamylaminecyclotransferase
MPDDARTLFVYGTLLSGEREHARLSGAECVGEARTEPMFNLVDLGVYPAMVLGGTTAVAGELYTVDASTLRELDVYEEVPVLFQRVRVRLENGALADAYVMETDQVRGKRRIAHGDWRKRMAPEVRPHDGAWARWARRR